MSVVGVIPAAGFARRLGELPCSKEVYPVRGRPVMDYVVERMREAGCEELRVVTRRDKEDVIGHSRELGASVIQAEPSSVAESVWLGVRDVAPTVRVLIGFPDTVWEPVDGFRTLLDALDDHDVVLGLFRTPDLTRSDVVVVNGSGMVEEIMIKPAQPPSEWIWGCAAARRRALDGLALSGEPGAHFRKLALGGRVMGVQLSDEWVDIGTTEGLERASTRLNAHATHGRNERA